MYHPNCDLPLMPTVELPEVDDVSDKTDDIRFAVGRIALAPRFSSSTRKKIRPKQNTRISDNQELLSLSPAPRSRDPLPSAVIYPGTETKAERTRVVVGPFTYRRLCELIAPTCDTLMFFDDLPSFLGLVVVVEESVPFGTPVNLAIQNLTGGAASIKGTVVVALKSHVERARSFPLVPSRKRTPELPLPSRASPLPFEYHMSPGAIAVSQVSLFVVNADDSLDSSTEIPSSDESCPSSDGSQ